MQLRIDSFWSDAETRDDRIRRWLYLRTTAERAPSQVRKSDYVAKRDVPIKAHRKAS